MIVQPSKRRLRRLMARPSAWRWDSDGWLVRPDRHGDPLHDAFANSHHTFRAAGFLHCRNRRQAALLDCGVVS